MKRAALDNWLTVTLLGGFPTSGEKNPPSPQLKRCEHANKIPPMTHHRAGYVVIQAFVCPFNHFHDTDIETGGGLCPSSRSLRRQSRSSQHGAKPKSTKPEDNAANEKQYAGPSDSTLGDLISGKNVQLITMWIVPRFWYMSQLPLTVSRVSSKLTSK